MPKKIYDIKPPKLVAEKKAEKKNTKVPLVIKKTKRQKQQSQAPKKHPMLLWQKIAIGTGVVLLILCVYLFFKLPKAEIAIWPKVDTLSFQQTIVADKSVQSIDLAKNIIPARYFQTSKTLSQDFPATGNASDEGHATGVITIYNKYDPPTPFTFKAGTRFMSDSGKIFVALQKISIPAAKNSGSKITPGSVQIQVQAAEGGTSYNIAASNFSVPGLKGTAYYYSVYATSSEPMAGGYSGKVKKVTADDIQEAKDVLTAKVSSEVMDDLKNQIPSDYVLLDNAILSSITSASTKTKAGTVADTFNYQVVASASAIAFKKSDLEQFAKDYIASQAPDGKKILETSFTISYSSKLADISGGKETLIVDFSSGVYTDIDKSSLALSLFGANSKQASQIINNTLGDNILKSEVKLWPLWTLSVPRNQKAVAIELKFE